MCKTRTLGPNLCRTSRGSSIVVGSHTLKNENRIKVAPEGIVECRPFYLCRYKPTIGQVQTNVRIDYSIRIGSIESILRCTRFTHSLIQTGRNQIHHWFTSKTKNNIIKTNNYYHIISVSTGSYIHIQKEYHENLIFLWYSIYIMEIWYKC